MEKCKNLVSVSNTFKTLLLQICSTEFLVNIGHKKSLGMCIKVRKSSSPKLLNKILRYCTQAVLGYSVIKFCSNGAATYIILEIIAKDNLNIAN